MHASRRVVAQQGIATAQFALGPKDVADEGVAKNFKETVKWYRLAAGQGGENAVVAKDILKPEMAPEQLAQAHSLAADLSKRIEASNSE